MSADHLHGQEKQLTKSDDELSRLTVSGSVFSERPPAQPNITEEGSTTACQKSSTTWTEELDRAAKDNRKQPWKEHFPAAKSEGEDLIDLKLPNQVQSAGGS